MAEVTLVVVHDMLATPGELVKDELTRKYTLRDEAGIVLMYTYDAGDIDTFAWPLSAYWLSQDWERKLVGALYDAREMGYFPSDVDVAVLPNGYRVGF